MSGVWVYVENHGGVVSTISKEAIGAARLVADGGQSPQKTGDQGDREDQRQAGAGRGQPGPGQLQRSGPGHLPAGTQQAALPDPAEYHEGEEKTAGCD